MGSEMCIRDSSFAHARQPRYYTAATAGVPHHCLHLGLFLWRQTCLMNKHTEVLSCKIYYSTTHGQEGTLASRAPIGLVTLQSAIQLNSSGSGGLTCWSLSDEDSVVSPCSGSSLIGGRLLSSPSVRQPRTCTSRPCHYPTNHCSARWRRPQVMRIRRSFIGHTDLARHAPRSSSRSPVRETAKNAPSNDFFLVVELYHDVSYRSFLHNATVGLVRSATLVIRPHVPCRSSIYVPVSSMRGALISRSVFNGEQISRSSPDARE